MRNRPALDAPLDSERLLAAADRLACARQFFDEQHCAQLASRHCAVTLPWQPWDATVAKSISFATFLGFHSAARGGVRCARVMNYPTDLKSEYVRTSRVY